MSFTEAYTAIVILSSIVILVLNSFGVSFIKTYEIYFVLIMTLFIFVLPAIAVIYNIFKEKRVLKENQ